MIQWKRVLAVGCMAAIACAGFADSYNRNSAQRRSRLGNPYFNGYRGYGTNPYYGSNPNYTQGYSSAVRPILTPAPASASLPPVSGPIDKYSPLEYGEIVKMALEASRKYDPAGPNAGGPRPTVVEVTTGTENAGKPTYSPVSIQVSDILDRGIFLLPTGEELRLRGITIPSNTDNNEVSRLYAKEAIQLLRNLTRDRDITILLDEPLRDNRGRLLGTILLSDGTELNRRMVEMGYAMVNEKDFESDVDFNDLTQAQNAARTNRLGIWSANF